jgi:tRNA (mo5U34)-methyltransferase
MSFATPQFLKDFDLHAKALQIAVQSALERPDARAEALKRLIGKMPQVQPSQIDLDGDRITIGRPTDLTVAQTDQLKAVLMGLKPWRKGPFDLFGIQIDSEWNSALKWSRAVPHIKPLQGRKILDVGASNGYYLFRMAAERPRLILGIEPYAVYYYQYLGLRRYLKTPGIYCLPLRLEELPDMRHWFDTIFCMGILYHRRSPLDTLVQLKQLLTAKGQLILETLIIKGDSDTALCPQRRYARMRNVFFIPTVQCLQNWLERCGFDRVRCIDITATTEAEQRKTSWIDSDSLDTFLDPHDDQRTVEGYPAPIRAMVVAEVK